MEKLVIVSFGVTMPNLLRKPQRRSNIPIMTAIFDTLWFLFSYAVAPFLVIWLLGSFIDACQHGKGNK